MRDRINALDHKMRKIGFVRVYVCACVYVCVCACMYQIIHSSIHPSACLNREKLKATSSELETVKAQRLEVPTAITTRMSTRLCAL